MERLRDEELDFNLLNSIDAAQKALEIWVMG